MQFTVKVRSTGEVLRFSDEDAVRTIGDLYKLIGDRHNIKKATLLLGDEMLTDFSVTLSDAGIVSGDRLFLSEGKAVQAVSGEDRAKTQKEMMVVDDVASQASTTRQPEEQQVLTKMTIETFRSWVSRAIRDTMVNCGHQDDSMSSWSGKGTLGFEQCFTSPTKRGIAVISGTVVQVLSRDDGNFEAIVTPYVIKDGGRSVLDSFVAMPMTCEADIRKGLVKLLTSSNSTISLGHVFLIDTLRDKVLKFLPPLSVCRVSAVNRTLRTALCSSHVDRTFWKSAVLRGFGAAEVADARINRMSFRSKYLSCIAKLGQGRNKCGPKIALMENPRLRIGQILPPGHIGPYPDINPFLQQPDPLNPLYDPRHPNFVHPFRHDPQMPDAPFGGLRGELMQPPRVPGRRPGDPFSRGGPPFSQFDSFDSY